MKPITPMPDILTPSPVPTLTTTPTPSPTPLATLSPEAAQQEIARLMETNNNCSGVCFWGITPGVSNFDESVRFLKTLDDYRLQVLNGIYNNSFEYKDDTIMVSLIFSDSNGLVQNIQVEAGEFDNPKVTGKDWLAFRPDNILRAYGIPKQVYIGMGQGMEGRLGYEMIFLYDQMAIKYDGNQTIFIPQKILHACPLVDHYVSLFRLRMGVYCRRLNCLMTFV